MACEAWSSAMMQRMFGRSPLAPDRDGSAEATEPPAMRPRKSRRFRVSGILHSVEDVGHRRCLPKLVGLKAPQRLAVHRVRGGQSATLFTEDDDASGGRERASPGFSGSGFR